LAVALALGASCSNKVKVDVADTDGDRGFFADDDLLGDTNPNDDDPSTSTELPLLASSATCALETRAAEQRTVAMYIMLDSSGSMEEPTGNGSTKWQAIQRAIRNFMAENREADLSIGLQFFPLLKPGSSFNCTRHSDCGPNGGPCFLSTCLQGETITLCQSNADCPGSPADNPCVDFGLCENSDPDAPLACVLGQRCQGELGLCENFERVCTQATECEVPPYAAPAVEIGVRRADVAVNRK
jgi:hypothetical protein